MLGKWKAVTVKVVFSDFLKKKKTILYRLQDLFCICECFACMYVHTMYMAGVRGG